MKTCKSFFHKSIIITSEDELKSRKAFFYTYAYGFCLVACQNRDYKAQRIYRFTDSYDIALAWLKTNENPECTDLCGIVLGSDL